MKESALRAAAGRGRLRAMRASESQWRSSCRWVGEYLAPLGFVPPDLDHAVRARLAVAVGEFPRHGYGGIQVVD